MRYISLIAFFLTFAVNNILGATITSTTTGGNWNSTSTWVGGKLPKQNDDVVIAGVVTINTDVTCKLLRISSGRTLNFATGGYTLTITGTWATVLENLGGTFNAGDGVVEFKTNSSSGQTVSGTFNFNEVIVDRVTQMNFGSSSTVNNKLTLLNGAQMVANGHPNYGINSTLEVNGTYSISTNYYLWGSTVVKTPAHIVIASGTVSAQQNISIVKSLTVSQGATLNVQTSCITLKSSTFEGITNNGTLNLGGVIVESGLTWNITQNLNLSNLTVQNGATVNAGSSTINFVYNTTGHCGANGIIINLIGSGTFNAGTGTVVINTSANGNGTFNGNVNLNNLVVSGGAILTNGNNSTIYISGNLTLNSGTNINYGNAIPVGTLTFGSDASITNNGGTTTNIINTVPTAPQPVVVSAGITILSSSNTGGGRVNGTFGLVAPNTYQLSSNLTINGSRRVLFVYPGAQFISNGNTISADSIYLFGKLVINNTNGLSGFLGTTKIFIDTSAIIEYNSNLDQIIQPRVFGTLNLKGQGRKILAPGNFIITKDFEVDSAGIDLSNEPTIIFNGNGNQNISADEFKSITLGGSGNKNLKRNTVVKGRLSIEGSAKLITEDRLTLASDATGTASIAPIPSTASVQGEVYYERYIPAGRLWRFIGWPLSGTTVANAWQTTVHVTGPGTGGSLGGFNSNGFDWTAAASPSVFTYNEQLNAGINNKWQAINNTNTTINPTAGYRIFIRGPRELGVSLLNGSNHPLQPVVLKGKGTINQGNITVNLTNSNGGGNDNGWHLLANPYPSAIDWNNAAWVAERGNTIQSTVYIYNPSQNKYGAWNPTGGGVNGGSSQIASGQAFFVKVNANTNLTFRENFKVDNGTVGLFGKTTNSVAQTNNLKISIGETGKIYDETVVYIHAAATKGLDNEYDAIKPDVTNASISTYTSTDNSKLLINAIPNNVTDTVKLNTPLANANYNYLLRFNGSETFAGSYKKLTLIDNFTQNQFVIDTANSVYAFSTVLNNSASRAADRFSLIIGNQQALPVKLSSFYARSFNNHIELNWMTSAEKDNKNFEVERSADGITFENIGMVKGAGNSNVNLKYTFTDNNPFDGVNYYRLKQNDFNGTYTYTQVVLVDRGGDKLNLKLKPIVFPVPANDVLHVDLKNEQNTQAKIIVTDILGSEVLVEKVDADETNFIYPLPVSSLVKGIYMIAIEQSNGDKVTLRFIKE